MPTIEIDEDAREILRKWKQVFAKNGKCLDYSECIRFVNDKAMVLAKGRLRLMPKSPHPMITAAPNEIKRYKR
jgi:hypothetical protein